MHLPVLQLGLQRTIRADATYDTSLSTTEPFCFFRAATSAKEMFISTANIKEITERVYI